MTASEIIASSEMCRQASRNIYPTDPDELFNVVWLKIREREIQDATFFPDNPKRYFLRAMRNQVVDWRRAKTVQFHEGGISFDLDFDDDANVEVKRRINKIISQTHLDNSDITSTELPSTAFINDWLNQPTEDEDLLFLKNILTLALNCNNNKAVISMIGISDRQYYTYKKLAKQRLYDDYNASNISDISSADLV